VDYAVVAAQVAASTRAELERLARESDRSLSAEIRRALTRHLAERDEREEAIHAAPGP
jgi:hypothetical protein